MNVAVRLGINGHIIVYFDHGSYHEGYHVHSNNESKGELTIVFSGNRKSVDDIIARDIHWLQTNLQKDVIVVTEDLQLRKRCRNAVMDSRINKKKDKKKQLASADNSVRSMKTLTIIASPLFIETLYEKVEQHVVVNSNSVNDHSSNSSVVRMVNLDEEVLSLMKEEVLFRQQIESLQKQLSTSTRKTRLGVNTRLESITNRLKEIVTKSSTAIQALELDSADVDVTHTNSVHSSVSVGKSTAESAIADNLFHQSISENTYSFNVVKKSRELIQQLVLEARYGNSKNIINRNNRRRISRAARNPAKVNSPEETWERIILAECMRYSLQTLGHYYNIDSVISTDSSSKNYLSEAEIALLDINSGDLQNVNNRKKPSLLKKYVDYINSLQ